MKGVIVSKSELLAKLKANRTKHRGVDLAERDSGG